MNFAVIIKIISLTLLLPIDPVRPLKCYQCRSDKHENCDEIIGTDYLQECFDESDVVTPEQNATETEGGSAEKVNTDTEDGQNMTEIATEPTLGPFIICRKIIQVLYVKPPGDTVIIRECGRTYIGEECIKTSNKLVYIKACDCKGDGCNRSMMLLVTVPLLISCVVINYFV